MRSFFLFFIAIIFFFTSGVSSYAQEAVVNQASDSPKPKNVSYEMAYPGMLPDSPLYKLKVLRDKAITFLISDPLKKIDFYLLQADKGLGAASMLADKGNIELAKETALKAENNMTLISDQLRAMKTKPEDGLFERLKTASRKHQETITHMIQITDGEDRKTFSQVLDFSKRNLRSIESFQKMTLQEWQKKSK